MKTAVETVFIGKDRQYNRRFLRMCGHYLVEPTACTPAAAGKRAGSRTRSGWCANVSLRRGCGCRAESVLGRAAPWAGRCLDAICGAGGLLTVPLLLGLGFPPIQALATDKLQGVFDTGSSTLAFVRAGRIDVRTMWPAVLSAAIGAALGTLAVQQIDIDILRRLIPLALIAVALYFLFSPRLGDADQPPRIPVSLFAPLAAGGRRQAASLFTTDSSVSAPGLFWSHLWQACSARTCARRRPMPSCSTSRAMWGHSRFLRSAATSCGQQVSLWRRDRSSARGSGRESFWRKAPTSSVRS